MVYLSSKASLEIFADFIINFWQLYLSWIKYIPKL